LELIYLFCQKLGIDLGVNMEAVAKINEQLKDIRSELNISVFGKDKPAPKPFNPLVDATPAEVETQLDRAVAAAQKDDFVTLLDAAQKIEAYFGFPAPNKLVQEAEIPGGMYSNMVAQLQALKAEDILPKAMELIPEVRLSAGLPPLVTPTSQIVGAQAVNCALDLKAGREMYTTKNNQFVSLVKGEYGTTPVKIDPEFRFKICGVREESNYDISKYQHQPNPELPEAGGVKLAENEKEELLLELFPLVAKPYLTGVKTKAYQAKVAAEAPAKEEAAAPAEPKAQPITGHTIVAPLPGKVIEFKVKVGDAVALGQEVALLEAMKMENSITADAAGYVKQLLVVPGENVATDAILIELSDAPVAVAAAPAAPKAVSGNKVVAPLPGRVIALKVKEGDTVNAGDEVVVLEAMKMENSITSDYSGTVLQVAVAEGDNVASDSVLLIIG
jgi:pyruvate carboxylase subunit B